VGLGFPNPEGPLSPFTKIILKGNLPPDPSLSFRNNNYENK